MNEPRIYVRYIEKGNKKVGVLYKSTYDDLKDVTILEAREHPRRNQHENL